jgi:hypothetical protein
MRIVLIDHLFTIGVKKSPRNVILKSYSILFSVGSIELNSLFLQIKK